MGFLTITRKKNQAVEVRVDGELVLRVIVTKVQGKQTSISFEADKGRVHIRRAEVSALQPENEYDLFPVPPHG